MALIDKLTDIGDAIREKNGTTEPVPLKDMPQAILDISSGGAEAAIDYIESIGGQYIDTGIAIQKGYRVEIDFQLKSANGYMCGVVDNGDWANAFQAGIDNNAFYYRGHFTYSQYSTLLGRTLAVGKGAMNYTNTLHLFARNWKNNECYASMKLFSCVIYDADNNIIQALVPAVDKNNVVCLYDNVTKSYFYNQGQGAFKGGVMGDDAKEEQEKTIDITENGTTEVLPDEGKVLSRVIVNADVQSGGDTEALERLIDESGVLDSTEGSVSEKVEKLIDLVEENTLPENAAVVFDYYTDGDYIGEVKKITINRSTAIPKYMFSDNTVPNKYYNYVEEIELNDEITEIGNNAFSRISLLKKVKLPNSLIQIGSAGFSGVALEELSFPETLQSIGGYCFEGCRLENLIFPKALQEINSYAFQRCPNLKAVYFKGMPTSVSSTTFYNDVHITDIYVPWSEGEVANAPWGATNATIHYNYVEGEETNEDS